MTRVRIYVGTLPNGLPAADRDGFGIFRVINDFGEMNPIHGVAYEPEVPRCANCSRYTVNEYDRESPFHRAWCEPDTVTVTKLLKLVPSDGSGYCHEHTSKPEKLSDVNEANARAVEDGAS